MTKIFFIIFLLLSTLGLYSQNTIDCKSFKTGKFKVEGAKNSIIKRTKKYQFEKSENVNLKDRLVWLSNCKYKLTPLKEKKDKLEKIDNRIIYFEIIETGLDFYIVRVTNDLDDFTSDFKMIRV